MIFSRIGRLLAAAVLLAAPAVAQLTPQQALDRRAISDLQFSHDGARLAFVVTEPPKGTTRNSDIWMVDLATREARQLTRALRRTVRAWRFSPPATAPRRSTCCTSRVASPNA
jgi:dipeptidyl aminopeptidase/acylaminoacyl peptidase